MLEQVDYVSAATVAVAVANGLIGAEEGIVDGAPTVAELSNGWDFKGGVATAGIVALGVIVLPVIYDIIMNGAPKNHSELIGDSFFCPR